MLDAGVALAPGAYEVVFPGLAHDDAVLDEVAAPPPTPHDPRPDPSSANCTRNAPSTARFAHASSREGPAVRSGLPNEGQHLSWTSRALPTDVEDLPAAAGEPVVPVLVSALGAMTEVELPAVGLHAEADAGNAKSRMPTRRPAASRTTRWRASGGRPGARRHGSTSSRARALGPPASLQPRRAAVSTTPVPCLTGPVQSLRGRLVSRRLHAPPAGVGGARSPCRSRPPSPDRTTSAEARSPARGRPSSGRSGAASGRGARRRPVVRVRWRRATVSSSGPLGKPSEPCSAAAARARRPPEIRSRAPGRAGPAPARPATAREHAARRARVGSSCHGRDVPS